MNEARKFAKGRKPVKRIWSMERRPVLINRKKVPPEAYEALPNSSKYPPKLLKAREEPYRCGTMMLRIAEFVGPPRPSLESRHSGYPLTNWKRKRLEWSHSYRFIQRRFLKNPRYL